MALLLVNGTSVLDGQDAKILLKTINNNAITGSGNITIDSLPSQTGQSGKFLTTDGTNASWSTVTFPTVDQTYDGTSSNAQSGVAIAGAGFLQNNSTDVDGLSILGYPSSAPKATSIGASSRGSNYSVAVGYLANAGHSATALGYNANAEQNSIVIGYDANTSSRYSTAIGYMSTVNNSGTSSIQLGYGSNNTAKSFNVGFYDNVTPTNYQLLDGTTGLIPYQRIKSLTETRNDGQLKFWTGTKAQYDAIVTKDGNTLYNITDDADATLPLLELLFPVGAVYFGTMSVCPLQTLGVGTWQALPQDKVIQIAGTRGSVGNTIEAGLPNITGNIEQCQIKYPVSASGAFSASSEVEASWQSDGNRNTVSLNFDASNSSSIYGHSDTVQPDAYLLNGWRRIS